MDISDKINDFIGVENANKEPSGTVVNNISVYGNSFVSGSPGTGISSGGSSIQVDTNGNRGEMEDDLVRVFRGLTTRERVKFMQNTYDYEEKCVENREKDKNK